MIPELKTIFLIGGDKLLALLDPVEHYLAPNFKKRLIL